MTSCAFGHLTSPPSRLPPNPTLKKIINFSFPYFRHPLSVQDTLLIRYTACCLLLLLERVQIDGDNESVESEHLRKDENEDHADKETRLLRCTAHARVAHDAHGVAGGQAGQAHRQAGSQVDKAPGKYDNFISVS